jgi:hypothetical protein
MPFLIYLQDFHVEIHQLLILKNEILSRLKIKQKIFFLQKFSKINPIIIVCIECFEYKITIFISFTFRIKSLFNIKKKRINLRFTFI